MHEGKVITIASKAHQVKSAISSIIQWCIKEGKRISTLTPFPLVSAHWIRWVVQCPLMGSFTPFLKAAVGYFATETASVSSRKRAYENRERRSIAIYCFTSVCILSHRSKSVRFTGPIVLSTLNMHSRVNFTLSAYICPCIRSNMYTIQTTSASSCNVHGRETLPFSLSRLSCRLQNQCVR